MSVAERRRIFEEQRLVDGATKSRTPSVVVPSEAADESRPKLPPRPGSQSNVAKQKRPLIPPKSKSISSRLVTSARNDPIVSEEITLIDLEEHDADTPDLVILEPQAIDDDDDDDEDVSSQETRQPSNLSFQGGRNGTLSQNLDPLAIRNKPKPPRVLRTVSENTQNALRVVQLEAPKAWQGFAGSTQKAFSQIQKDAPKAFKNASERMQKVSNDVNTGIKRTVSGMPIPKPFAETAEDLTDLTKLSIGQAGICSRCASLPLKKCFPSPDGANGEEQAYIPWATPLSRIALHAKWCGLCQLLLSMLCRREHDPLLLPEVRDFINPEWLRGVPLSKWVAEGYIHQDEYWPFGRSECRYEGSTQMVGPFAENLWAVAKETRGVGMKLLARSAAGRRPYLSVKDFQKSPTQRYKEGYRAGRSLWSFGSDLKDVLIRAAAIR